MTASLAIRFQRFGYKGRPFYRIVVAPRTYVFYYIIIIPRCIELRSNMDRMTAVARLTIDNLFVFLSLFPRPHLLSLPNTYPFSMSFVPHRHNVHASPPQLLLLEISARRDGKFIEILGNYNPRLDRVGLRNVRLNISRFHFFVANGAKISLPVQRLAAKFNLMPPPPIKIPLPLHEVKPEMLPKPRFYKQPLPVTRTERY